MQTNTRNDISAIINEKKAAELRSKLLLYHFYYVNNVSNVDSEEEKRIHVEDKIKKITPDGRLRELFIPLVTVVPVSSTLSTLSTPQQSIEDALLDFIRHRNQSRLNEERQSHDAVLTESITDCLDCLEKGRILLDTIVEKFNEGKSDKEQWTNRAVSAKLKDMGFEAVRIGRGTMLIMDAKLLSALQKKYSIVPTDCFAEV
jgi:hypothetical protein